MRLEIFAKEILVVSRIKFWKKIIKKITKNEKNDIYNQIKKWLIEWSIIWYRKNVVWFWKIINKQKNPLLK